MDDRVAKTMDDFLLMSLSFVHLPSSVVEPLYRRFSALTGADPYDFLHRRHKDLAVADAACLGRCLDRFDYLGDKRIGGNDLELYLGKKVNHIFGAPVEFGVTFLPSETLYLGHGNALHADSIQGVLYLVELKWFYDRLDLFHGQNLLSVQSIFIAILMLTIEDWNFNRLYEINREIMPKKKARD